MSRLTYKSMCGDYGSVKEYDSPYAEIQTLRNALGRYEDLGTVEELQSLIPKLVIKNVNNNFYRKDSRKMTKNKDLREYAKNKGVKLWEVAEKYGVNDGNFSRKLRRELPAEEKQKIISIIDQISSERGAG